MQTITHHAALGFGPNSDSYCGSKWPTVVAHCLRGQGISSDELKSLNGGILSDEDSGGVHCNNVKIE